jgi:hypothetical protein
VEVLWKAWENGTPDVRQETLLEAADVSASRLQHLFRTKDKKHHPAWGVMIVPNPEGVKGLYRLNGGDTP